MNKKLKNCPSCKCSDVIASEPEEYQYKQSGLDYLVLRGGVKIIECTRCKETYTHIDCELQLLQVIALMLLGKPGLLGGAELRYLRKSCDLSQQALANLTGMKRETINKNEAKLESRVTRANEFMMRAVLIEQFAKSLRDSPEDNHLEPLHLSDLDEMRRAFTTKTQTFGEFFNYPAVSASLREESWEATPPPVPL